MSVTLTIHSEEAASGKGRSFSAETLAYATCSSLWEGGSSTEAFRPVFLLVAASDAEIRSVMENLRMGRKATMRGAHLASSGVTVELLRSAGYRFEIQRTAEGTLLTAYLPAFFDFQPGYVDAERVAFILLPSHEDLLSLRLPGEEEAAARRHVEALGLAAESSPHLVAAADLWASYLDERSELPIPPEADFRLQLHLAALQAGVASRSLPLAASGTSGPHSHERFGYREYVATGLKLAPGVVTNATHGELRTLVAAEIGRYETAKAKQAVCTPSSVSVIPTRARRNTRAGRRESHVSP